MRRSHSVSVPDWAEEAKDRLRFFRLRGTSSADTVQLGERLVSRAGQGTEWFGRREYVPGDPLNIIDWRALARRADLADPPMYSKTFEAERANMITIAVDCSGSMDTYPLDGKLSTALGVGALLAYTAVQSSDPVRVVLVGCIGGEPVLAGHVSRTVQDFYDAMREIDELRIAAAGDLFLDVLHDAHEGVPQLGHTAVLISDFFVEAETLAWCLFEFCRRVRTVLAVRVLGASDHNPIARVADLELYDVEQPACRRLTRWDRGLYASVLAEHSRLVEEIFADQGVPLAQVDAVPLDRQSRRASAARRVDRIIEELIERELVEPI